MMRFNKRTMRQPDLRKREKRPMTMALIAFFLLLLILPPALRAETPGWLRMWNDPKYSIYEVKEAFDNHFQDHPKGKGTGYKQFMRWFSTMEPRLYPSGRRDQVNPNQAWNEIKSFNKHFSSPTQPAWTPLGPTHWQNIDGSWSPGNGRIDAIWRHPSDENIIYIGSPSGGLWKTVDGGANWQPLTDGIPVMGISGIAVDHTNSDIIYIATGDKDSQSCYSIGVLKSTDGGLTWNPTGLSFLVSQYKRISKMIMHPTKSSILYAGMSDGLYRTTDSGTTWHRVLEGDVDDIEFKPGSPATVYVLKEEWVFIPPSMVRVSKFCKSADEGETFSIMEIPGAKERAQITVTNANPAYVYFFSSIGGFYRSEDSGATFTRRGDNPCHGNSSWYMWACAASHTNAEEVHVGEFETYKTTDGGSTWIQTSSWLYPNPVGYIHCDIHEMIFFGETLYVGSDGLISKTSDGGATWQILNNGICTTQIYRIGLSKTNPNKYIFGSQDNGTYYFDGGNWYGYLGADGMECMYDHGNEDIFYGTSQNGVWYCRAIAISQPGEGAWITPAVMHPTDPAIIYVGTEHIQKTTNRMQSWTTIGSFGSGFVNCLAIAPGNPDYLYASKKGKLWRTKDSGETWTELNVGSSELWITGIAVSYSNPERIAITRSGYRPGYKVFRSDNAGDTWSNISYNLPNLPANCVAFQNNGKDGLYVGGDVGVYYIEGNQASWNSFSNGLPNVIINDLEIHEGARKIRAGTYGRGMWEADFYKPPSGPVADFYVNTESGSNVAIFTDTSTCGGCTIRNWNWDFGDGTTSTVQHPIHTYKQDGQFMVVLTVTNDQTPPKTSIKSLLVTVPKPLAYCESMSLDCSQEYIRQVRIGSFVNSSAATTYSDFTSLTVDLFKNRPTEFSLMPEFPKSSRPLFLEWWRIWIDLNQNGSFSDPGELVFDTGMGIPLPPTGLITIPDSALSGRTRMRVVMKYPMGQNPAPSECGTFNYGEVEDYTIHIADPAIQITRPNGGETLISGSDYSLEWMYTGIVGNVRIDYSIDNGSSWLLIDGDVVNDHQYTWRVANTPSTRCLIRIMEADGNPADQSNGIFTILSPSVTVVSPNGGEQWEVGSVQNITWTSAGPIPNVRIEYSADKGATWREIVSSTANTGRYTWMMVANTPAANCLVRISDAANGKVADTSNSGFSIVYEAPAIYPEMIWGNPQVGASTQIDWISRGWIPDVRIEYSTDGGSTWRSPAIADSTPNRRTFSWLVPNTVSSTCRVRVSAVSLPGVAGISDNFMIFPGYQPEKGFPDFDNNGICDIIWRNYRSGENSAWLMNGDGTIREVIELPIVDDPAWKIAGVNDVNRVGLPDLFWRYYSDRGEQGRNQLWFMNSEGTMRWSHELQTVEDLHWRLGGIGDFDHDGIPDFFWRHHTTGENTIWLMATEVEIKSIRDLSAEMDLNWQISGVGDFDADGIIDILWHNNENARNRIWLMNDAGKVKESRVLTSLVDLNWKVGGVGDVNGDGIRDIIWRNYGTGQNIAWIFNADGSVNRTVALPLEPDLDKYMTNSGESSSEGSESPGFM